MCNKTTNKRNPERNPIAIAIAALSPSSHKLVERLKTILLVSRRPHSSLSAAHSAACAGDWGGRGGRRIGMCRTGAHLEELSRVIHTLGNLIAASYGRDFFLIVQKKRKELTNDVRRLKERKKHIYVLYIPEKVTVSK